MKLTSKALAFVLFAVIFGGIAITSLLGWWQTISTKTPAAYQSGEFAGQYNPADIRGSYKFSEISSLFAIPLNDLATAFLVPADTADLGGFQVKSLETQFAASGYEIGTNSVRVFVAFYKGLPVDLSTENYLPKQAAEILNKQGKMTAEQAAYLAKYTVDLSQVPAPSATPAPAAQGTPAPAVQGTPAPTPAVAATTHVAPDRTITSKTTFQDLLTWGVSQAAIEKVLAAPMPNASMIIKDYYTSKALEFSSGKTALQAEVDKVK